MATTTTRTPAARTAIADDRLLRAVATCFTVGVLLHNGDHLRRGSGAMTTDVLVAGTLAIVVEVAVVVLIFQRHRLAPAASLVAGFSLAAGYVLVHALPTRSWLSDSLTAGGAEWLSRVAASIEVAAALALGIVGLLAVRHRGGLSSSIRPHANEAPRPWTEVARQPVVIAMAAGNLVLLIATFATR